MKKPLLFLALTIAASIPLFVSAQGFVPLAPIEGLTKGVAANTEGLATFFNNLYKFLIGIAAVLAIIMIIWGGLQYATQDIPGAKQEGKDRILQAIFGLILVLSPVLVFSIINPSILNLSINLPKLDTASGPPGDPGSGSAGGNPTTPRTQIPDPATGCSFSGTLLKKATCPTQNAANNFAASPMCTANGSGSVLPCQGGVNSSGCLDTAYYATCDTTSGSFTGPYTFLDVSPKGTLNVFGHDIYQPIASTPNNTNNGIPANPNNGNAVIQFQTNCKNDGGIVCMSTVKTTILRDYCTYSTSQSPTQINTCSLISIYCTNNPPSASFLGGCGQLFSIIQ